MKYSRNIKANKNNVRDNKNVTTTSLDNLNGVITPPVRDPLKRITDARSVELRDGFFFYKGDKYIGNYYKSGIYENLMEELLLKPIEQLEKEGYWIPAWKYKLVNGDFSKDLTKKK